jgi:glyoxylase-like metal-dependent hydrolase (beta-lactamase superfamily II)
MNVHRIGRVSVLEGARGGKYPAGNSVLVEGDVRLLIDPSTSVVEAGREIAGGPVDILVNSHAHEDHFAGNHLFPEAELALHEADAGSMASLEALLAAYGMPPEMDEDWGRLVVEHYHFEPRDDVRSLVEGEVIDCGRSRVHVLHTPGHTPGHICLRIEPEAVVFLGDWDLTSFGPYYGDATASLDATLASLDRLAELRDVQAFVSFHEAGVVTEDLGGALARYRAVIDRRDADLLAFLDRPRTLDEIGDRCIVYRKRYEKLAWQPHVERVMMGRHLERLAAAGAVSRTADGWRAV